MAELQQIDSDNAKWFINGVCVAQRRTNVLRILVEWNVSIIHFSIFFLIITWAAVIKMVIINITTEVYLIVFSLFNMTVGTKLPTIKMLIDINITCKDCATSGQYIFTIDDSCKFSWCYATTVLKSPQSGSLCRLLFYPA